MMRLNGAPRADPDERNQYSHRQDDEGAPEAAITSEAGRHAVWRGGLALFRLSLSVHGRPHHRALVTGDVAFRPPAAMPVWTGQCNTELRRERTDRGRTSFPHRFGSPYEKKITFSCEA